MPTTAQTIIEGGYARSAKLEPGKIANDGELLGRLGRVFPSLFALAARQRPGEFTSSALLTLAGVPATGVLSSASPALTDVIEIRRVIGSVGTAAAGAKVHLVEETEVYRTWQIPPTVFRRGLALVSRGQSGDPVAGDVLQLIVLDSPAVITALTTPIDTRFPQRHLEILVNDIALYLIAKDGVASPAQEQAVRLDQTMKLNIFASEYNVSASAVEAILADRVPAAVGR